MSLRILFFFSFNFVSACSVSFADLPPDSVLPGEEFANYAGETAISPA